MYFFILCGNKDYYYYYYYYCVNVHQQAVRENRGRPWRLLSNFVCLRVVSSEQQPYATRDETQETTTWTKQGKLSKNRKVFRKINCWRCENLTILQNHKCCHSWYDHILHSSGIALHSTEIQWKLKCGYLI